jgi:hypothetical protein
MRGYLFYAVAVILGFGMWWLLFAAMRRREIPGGKFLGYFLLGPMHGYLKRRNYSLSKRELLGWLVVGVLMLAAPIVSKMLEG